LPDAPLTEPQVAPLLAAQVPAETPILLASSMPVRDWESLAGRPATDLRPFANRGVNGIDGTLATALGIAQATARPTVLLTGDLAFLHDTNGLLLASSGHWQGSLTVICVDNGGGGIFGHLPIATVDDVYEPFFATPQCVDLSALVQSYGLPAQTVIGRLDLLPAVQTLPATGLHFYRIPTDRAADAAWRKM
jgi:2-succinyl-5-enolpyruvyl-6-hydroxy-3-cyclohexene-1-carboxylate synthase